MTEEEKKKKEKKKKYRRVKNIHLVDKNNIYSFYELRTLLGYPSNDPIYYFISLGLRHIDCNRHGEELIAFHKYLRDEFSKHLPNQIWCTKCREYKEVKNNEIFVEINYKIQYKTGEYKIKIMGECAYCGHSFSLISCTSKLSELEKNFKINYLN